MPGVEREDRVNGFRVETLSVLPRHIPEQVGGLEMTRPDENDVIVRQRRGNPHVVYLLGTPTAPDQFILGTRDEAVTRAIAFARRQRVRAWFDNGDDTFLLLGTFADAK